MLSSSRPQRSARAIQTSSPTILSMRRGSAASSSPPSSSNAFPALETFTSQKIVTSPSSRMTGSKALDHARAAEAPGRDAAESHRLVDILLEIAIQSMLEQSRIAVVVFGRDDDQAIRSEHRLCEFRVFDRLASIHG